AGTAMNVIPESVEITGTMRSFNRETRKLLQEEMKRASKVVEALGGKVDLTITEGYPPVINDDKATEVAFSALRGVLGENRVFEAPPIMAAEDFAYMAQEAPSCYLALGVRGHDWEDEFNVHTPTFRIDESALKVGTASMVAMAVEWMQRNGEN
ncbi:MAG: M20/M25/M40 family metallo-hydrolase, partial [Chloroflexota bacterium]